MAALVPTQLVRMRTCINQPRPLTVISARGGGHVKQCLDDVMVVHEHHHAREQL